MGFLLALFERGAILSLMPNVNPQDPSVHAQGMAGLTAWHESEKNRLARAISLTKTSADRSAARAAQAAHEVEYRRLLKEMRGRHF